MGRIEGEENKKIELLRLKLAEYYSPGIQSYWNGYPNDFKVEEIIAKVSQNLYLADSDVTLLIGELLEYMDLHDIQKEKDAMARFLLKLISLFDVLWEDYERLRKRYYQLNKTEPVKLTKPTFWKMKWDEIIKESESTGGRGE